MPTATLSGFARVAAAVAAAALCCSTAQSQPAPASTIEPAVDQAMTRFLVAPQVRRALDVVKADHDRTLVDLMLLPSSCRGSAASSSIARTARCGSRSG